MGLATASVLTEGQTPSQLRDSGGLGRTRTALSSCDHSEGMDPSLQLLTLLQCSSVTAVPVF